MEGKYVGKNVFAKCKLAKKYKPPQRRAGEKVPREDELNLLLDNSTGRLHAMIFTDAYTGLRTQELRALEWDQHVDLDRGIIRVRQAVKAWIKNSRRIIGSTKTEDERDQPLPPECVLALKEWRLQCPRANTSLNGFLTTEEKAVQIAQYIRAHDDVGEDIARYQRGKVFQKELMKRFGVAGETIILIRRALRQGHPFTPTGKLKYVFPNEKGGILHEVTFEVQFKALQVKLKMIDANGKPKYSPHSLRHFYGSYLLKQGHEITEVQKLMGHSQLQTTVNMYLHLLSKPEETAAKVSASFSSLRKEGDKAAKVPTVVKLPPTKTGSISDMAS
jgi:integrase